MPWMLMFLENNTLQEHYQEFLKQALLLCPKLYNTKQTVLLEAIVLSADEYCFTLGSSWDRLN